MAIKSYRIVLRVDMDEARLQDIREGFEDAVFSGLEKAQALEIIEVSRYSPIRAARTKRLQHEMRKYEEELKRECAALEG